jgi:DNA (cytosine-5)-methyltransferase 1
MNQKINILENLRLESISIFENQQVYPLIITENIDVLIQGIDKNKSLVSALVTSVLTKICEPTQDIRLHRTDFEGGYSARTLDTNVTAPFFKRRFPKYANKESAFLTLATREKIEWNKVDGQSLKIRDKRIKNSFLNIIDAVENKVVEPSYVLIYLFHKLHILSLRQQQIFEETA